MGTCPTSYLSSYHTSSLSTHRATRPIRRLYVWKMAVRRAWLSFTFTSFVLIFVFCLAVIARSVFRCFRWVGEVGSLTLGCHIGVSLLVRIKYYLSLARYFGISAVSVFSLFRCFRCLRRSRPDLEGRRHPSHFISSLTSTWRCSNHTAVRLGVVRLRLLAVALRREDRFHSNWVVGWLCAVDPLSIPNSKT